MCVSGGKKYQFFGKFCVRSKWKKLDKEVYNEMNCNSLVWEITVGIT